MNGQLYSIPTRCKVRRSETAREFSEEEVPYFLWDRHVTTRDLRRILASTSDPRRISMLALLLREARPEDVWSFVSPTAVVEAWKDVQQQLGRRRAFWAWLLDAWRKHGRFE